MDWQQMAEWRDRLKPVFSSVSKEAEIAMRHDTHYDAMNYEFSTVMGNEIYRIDFQPTEKYSINVTKYVDTFPVFPRLFRMLHGVIPMFPYLAKIRYERLGEIDGGLDGDDLKASIKGYLKDAL